MLSLGFLLPDPPKEFLRIFLGLPALIRWLPAQFLDLATSRRNGILTTLDQGESNLRGCRTSPFLTDLWLRGIHGEGIVFFSLDSPHYNVYKTQHENDQRSPPPFGNANLRFGTITGDPNKVICRNFHGPGKRPLPIRRQLPKLPYGWLRLSMLPAYRPKGVEFSLPLSYH